MPKQKPTNDPAVVRVQFTPDELLDLDRWIALRGVASRADAIRQLVRSAIDLDFEWAEAKQSADDGRVEHSWPLRGGSE